MHILQFCNKSYLTFKYFYFKNPKITISNSLEKIINCPRAILRQILFSGCRHRLKMTGTCTYTEPKAISIVGLNISVLCLRQMLKSRLNPIKHVIGACETLVARERFPISSRQWKKIDYSRKGALSTNL